MALLTLQMQMFVVHEQEDKVPVKEISRTVKLLLLSEKCWQLSGEENPR